MSHQPVLLTPSIPSIEEGLVHWNDATAPFNPDVPHLEQGDQSAVDTLKADDMQQVDKGLESTFSGPSPMSGSPSPSIRDSASVHSLPAVQVTEPHHSPALPQGPGIPSLSDDDSMTPARRSVGSSTSAHLLSPRRSIRSRAAIDVRRV